MRDAHGLVPPGAERRFVDVGAGRLGVLRAAGPADRTPLLLVHGGGTDAAAISWYRLVEPLAAHGAVWAPDLPGFGASLGVEPVGGSDALAEVLVEVLDAVGVERAVVMGVSMGGDVAMNLAIAHPDRVAALVLVAPGGLVARFGGRFTQAAAWAAAQLPDRILLPLGNLANRFVRTALKAVVRDVGTLPAPAVDEFARLARDPRGAKGYARYNQASLGRTGMRNDLSGRVHAITVPTLFFHASGDPLVPIAGSRAAASAMPDARLVEVPDTGHWAQLEAHDRFLAEVRPFLAALA